MPYIKISNPDVIDLAAWQQVINVVNRHDDTIGQLTNNFGLAWSPVWTNDDWTSPFDSGSQLIVYGKAKVVAGTAGVTGPTLVSGSTYMLEQTISFNQTFSNPPVITATITSLTASSANQSLYNATITIETVSTTDFLVRISGLDSSDTQVSLNWIAIGPRA
jgi:H-type lectin domain